MLQQLRRDFVHSQTQIRRHVPSTTRAHLQRDKHQVTSDAPQGVLAGRRLAPRTEASTKPFAVNKDATTTVTTVTPLSGSITPSATHHASNAEHKEILRQAESLFLRGEYEQALVWFHRGRRLRPKTREFHTGIVKCERAINNKCPLRKCMMTS